MSILLIEDSPIETLMVREALHDLGLDRTLYTVTGGQAAMAFLRQRAPYESAPQPSLILLDLNLPGQSGQEILEEIKSDDALRTTVVIVLTTSREDRDLRKAWSSNVNGYIVKPANFSALVKVMGIVRDFWLHTVTLPGMLSIL